MGEYLKPWTAEPCEQCGCEHYLTRTYGRDRRPVEVCGECDAYERGASEATPSAHPHPLVALLAEALAVTDPERPPYRVEFGAPGLHRHSIRLEWDVRGPVTLERADGAYRVFTVCPDQWSTTTDPAEARAWLAAALEAT